MNYYQYISLIELFGKFPDNRTAEEWFETERWGAELVCPNCGCCNTCADTPNRKPMPYRCSACKKYFSVRTGTILERSKIPLQKWAIGIFLHLSNLKGVSSMKLHRDLKITQKSAWFMLHRIRQAYEVAGDRLDGPVEIDETFIGGKEKNKHSDKMLHADRGTVGKAVVAGVKDRETKEVRAEVVQGTDRDTLQGFVEDHVYPERPASSQTSTTPTRASVTMRPASTPSPGGWTDRRTPTASKASGQDTIEQMQVLFAGMVGKRLMYQNHVAKEG